MVVPKRTVTRTARKSTYGSGLIVNRSVIVDLCKCGCGNRLISSSMNKVYYGETSNEQR